MIKQSNSDCVPTALEKFKLDLSLSNAMTYINQYEQQKAEIEKKAIESARIAAEEKNKKRRKKEKKKIETEQRHARELEEIDRKAKEELAAAVEQAKAEVKEQAVAEILLEVKEFVPNAETQTRTYRISGTNEELEQG